MNNTFESYLNIKDIKVAKIKIDDIKMSFRLKNRLIRKDIKTIGDLLPYTMQDMYEVEGFGKSCEKELWEILDKYKASDADENIIEILDNTIISYTENILKGDFSFTESIEEKELIDIVNTYKKAYEETDSQLISSCIEFPERIVKYVKMLSKHNKKTETFFKIKTEIEVKNPARKNNKVFNYIEAYTDDINLQTKLRELSNDEMTLGDYFKVAYRNNDVNKEKDYIDFLRWCTFDISTEVKELIESIKKNERTYQIICARAKKETLEQIGSSFNVTRERIRQIEKKAIRNFQIWRKKNRILKKIFADCNGERILNRSILKEVIGNNCDIVIYLLKNDNADNVTYSKEFDSFVIGKSESVEGIQSFVSSLGKKIDKKLLDIIIDDAIKVYGFNEKLIKLAINTEYRLVGNTYYKGNITLETMYEYVLKKYYMNGIHIYDPEELNVFKQRVLQEFAMDISEKSDRSVAATIGRIGILCGRGKYCYKDEQLFEDISQVLYEIYCYIRDSEQTIFLMNSIYSIFEKELVEKNITNKYFLQGILKEKYGDKWFFSKDYISKDEKISSVHPSIIEAVKKYNHPISKEVLAREFPGVTDIVFSFALSDSNILHYFGSYYHVDNISISENEKQYIKKVIEKVLDKEGYVHCSKVYDVIGGEHKTLLTNNYVKYAFDLYALLEYLFGDEYNFSRPFISKRDIKMDNSDTILKGIVQDADEISIVDVVGFAREHHFVLNNILDFLDSCNETHLLINSNKLMRIDLIGLNNENIREILRMLSEEVSSTVAISSLSCVGKFPRMNVDWTDWLIYSIVKKWSTSLEVIPSSNQYRQSIPLIAPVGKASASEYVNMGISNMIKVADDMDDIDNIIGHLSLEELNEL